MVGTFVTKKRKTLRILHTIFDLQHSTPFSAKETDVGPYPFQRALLISLFFSSPVFSSTTVVGTDIGFALKLKTESGENKC